MKTFQELIETELSEDAYKDKHTHKAAIAKAKSQGAHRTAGDNEGKKKMLRKTTITQVDKKTGKATTKKRDKPLTNAQLTKSDRNHARAAKRKGVQIHQQRTAKQKAGQAKPQKARTAKYNARMK